MKADTTIRHPIASLERLEIPAGRKSHTWLGAGIGLLVGAGAGATLYPESDCGFVETTECKLYAALILGGAGAATGAVIGMLIKTDRWEEVPLDRLRVGVMPHRDGLGLGVSMVF